jgi:hypothetical protein
MEALDFLGGKYQRGNQILSGTLQTFRAMDPGTGRDVFVHRVASGDAVAHQLAFLLSSALVRSAKARRLVLDVAEQDGFAYVVTDTEHQCLLLREWLQFEIDQAAGSSAASHQTGSGSASAIAETIAKPAGVPSTPDPLPQKTAEPKQEPGEFTRMFMSGMSAPPGLAVKPEPLEDTEEDTEPSLPVMDETPTESTPQPQPEKHEPGEFTRMFLAATKAEQKGTPSPAKQTEPPKISNAERARTEVPPPPSTVPPEHEPGDFTRFFKGIDAPAKTAPEAPRRVERPSNPDFGGTAVQRPSTPVSPPPSSQGVSEFTRLFNSREGPPVTAPPKVPAAPASTSPPPASQKGTEPGEFTQFFNQREAPPVRPAESAPLPSGPAPTGGSQKGTEPGEFTKIFAGREAPPSRPSPNFPQAPPRNTPADPFAGRGQGDIFSEQSRSEPTPPAREGEYTRLFGPGGAAPPVQQPSAVASPPAPVSDDPLERASPQRAAPQQAPVPDQGPSEFTLVTSGGPLRPKPGEAPQPSGGSDASAPAIPAPQLQMNVAPPPLQGLQVPPPPSASASAGGMSASAQMGPASANVAGPRVPPPPAMNMNVPPPKVPTAGAGAPQATNSKLLLLFVILGVLAVLLVILIVLILKK